MRLAFGVSVYLWFARVCFVDLVACMFSFVELLDLCIVICFSGCVSFACGCVRVLLDGII